MPLFCKKAVQKISALLGFRHGTVNAQSPAYKNSWRGFFVKKRPL